MATIGGTLATAGDVKKEAAEARVVERRREERRVAVAWVAVHPEAEEEVAVAAREVDAVASEPAQRLSLFRTTASKEFTFLKARMMPLSLRTLTLANQSTTKSV